MTPLDFITYWHSQPFRPFRIHVKISADGLPRELEIVQLLQVAMSPNLQLVTLATDDGAVSIKVDEIERCEWLAEAPSESAPSTDNTVHALPPPGSVFGSPVFDSGTPVYFTFTTTTGHRMVHVSIDNAEGKSCFTTIGTRWDIHGHESFENGCTLYLHHLDRPLVPQRVIVWPRSNGTFESFSEALEFGDLYKELQARDAMCMAEPTDFSPPESYFRRAKPRPKPPIPESRYTGREDTDEDDRFIIKLGDEEVGPHHWASSPRVIDTMTDRVLMDLWNTKWDLCEISGGSPQRAVTGKAAEPSKDRPDEAGAPGVVLRPPWKLELRHFPEGRKVVTLAIDPELGVASFGGQTPHPLDFFERALKNFAQYEQWEWLQTILSQGPVETDQPQYCHALPGGYSLELWPGDEALACPFVQWRVIEPRRGDGAAGRVLFDMRGSVWTAYLMLWGDEPKLRLQFETKDNQGRSERCRLPLSLDFSSRRVVCERLEGSTSLGVLHTLVQEARTVEWLTKDLTEAFGRGARVPLP